MAWMPNTRKLPGIEAEGVFALRNPVALREQMRNAWQRVAVQAAIAPRGVRPLDAWRPVAAQLDGRPGRGAMAVGVPVAAPIRPAAVALAPVLRAQPVGRAVPGGRDLAHHELPVPRDPAPLIGGMIAAMRARALQLAGAETAGGNRDWRALGLSTLRYRRRRSRRSSRRRLGHTFQQLVDWNDDRGLFHRERDPAGAVRVARAEPNVDAMDAANTPEEEGLTALGTADLRLAELVEGQRELASAVERLEHRPALWQR